MDMLMQTWELYQPYYLFERRSSLIDDRIIKEWESEELEYKPTAIQFSDNRRQCFTLNFQSISVHTLKEVGKLETIRSTIEISFKLNLCQDNRKVKEIYGFSFNDDGTELYLFYRLEDEDKDNLQLPLDRRLEDFVKSSPPKWDLPINNFTCRLSTPDTKEEETETKEERRCFQVIDPSYFSFKSEGEDKKIKTLVIDGGTVDGLKLADIFELFQTPIKSPLDYKLNRKLDEWVAVGLLKIIHLFEKHAVLEFHGEAFPIWRAKLPFLKIRKL
jgi:hypothetical protein